MLRNCQLDPTKKPSKHEKVSILKNEIKFLTSKLKQLEEKLKISEAKENSQFEHIVKLEEKCRNLKESNQPRPASTKKPSEKNTEELKNLERKLQVLAHSKETESKRFSNLKADYERKVKALQDRVEILEAEVKEKEKENRLHAMKVKDVMRKVTDGAGINVVVKQAKELDRMMSRGSRHRKVRMRNTVVQNLESEPNHRARSIEPFAKSSKKHHLKKPAPLPINTSTSNSNTEDALDSSKHPLYTLPNPTHTSITSKNSTAHRMKISDLTSESNEIRPETIIDFGIIRAPVKPKVDILDRLQIDDEFENLGGDFNVLNLEF